MKIIWLQKIPQERKLLMKVVCEVELVESSSLEEFRPLAQIRIVVIEPVERSLVVDPVLKFTEDNVVVEEVASIHPLRIHWDKKITVDGVWLTAVWVIVLTGLWKLTLLTMDLMVHQSSIPMGLLIVSTRLEAPSSAILQIDYLTCRS